MVTQKVSKINKAHKDSVFTLLFGDPEKLRGLYNAITNSNYGPDTQIEINTLNDALYMNRINDISFTIGKELVILIEYQSTINENMPLRLLSYIARIYEKITSDKSIYKKTLIKIPRPQFIVLYNGTDPYPDKEILKLSEKSN
ncbi:hypothetical protein AGMMS49928_28750 [Spirochaetia bacterium]|nr:hypothetical protein AGMMS49928_28750 [Spirochaetia bacterium]